MAQQLYYLVKELSDGSRGVAQRAGTTKTKPQLSKKNYRIRNKLCTTLPCVVDLEVGAYTTAQKRTNTLTLKIKSWREQRQLIGHMFKSFRSLQTLI